MHLRKHLGLALIALALLSCSEQQARKPISQTSGAS